MLFAQPQNKSARTEQELLVQTETMTAGTVRKPAHENGVNKANQSRAGVAHLRGLPAGAAERTRNSAKHALYACAWQARQATHGKAPGHQVSLTALRSHCTTMQMLLWPGYLRPERSLCQLHDSPINPALSCSLCTSFWQAAATRSVKASC